jgi:hypothetical protein
MKITLLITMLVVLCGCETVSDIVREKRYTIQINETPNSIQTFGYNTDHEYIGFMISGSFGEKGVHKHSDNCSHSLKNIFK